MTVETSWSLSWTEPLCLHSITCWSSPSVQVWNQILTGRCFPTLWLAMVAGWRCNPCLIRDNDAMAAALKANHSFPTRPSAKKKASDQEFARWQTQNPKIDILRSILNQIMQVLNMICMPQSCGLQCFKFCHIWLLFKIPCCWDVVGSLDLFHVNLHHTYGNCSIVMKIICNSLSLQTMPSPSVTIIWSVGTCLHRSTCRRLWS